MAKNKKRDADDFEVVENDPTYPKRESPTDAARTLADKTGHVVETPERYEYVPLSESPSPGQPAEAGHMHVPTDNDDMTEEGWTAPTERGGGWEVPREPALEDTLDEREGE